MPSVTFIGNRLTVKGVEPDPTKVGVITGSQPQWAKPQYRILLECANTWPILSQLVWNSPSIERPYQRWMCISLVRRSRNGTQLDKESHHLCNRIMLLWCKLPGDTPSGYIWPYHGWGFTPRMPPCLLHVIYPQQNRAKLHPDREWLSCDCVFHG